MARLSAARRKKLPATAFAYPKARKYPIHDAGHRKAALREAAKPTTFGTYRHVKAQVCKKAPGTVGCTKRKGR